MSWKQACKHRHPHTKPLRGDPLAGMCLRVVHKDELCDKHYAEKVDLENESLRKENNELTNTVTELKSALNLIEEQETITWPGVS